VEGRGGGEEGEKERRTTTLPFPSDNAQGTSAFGRSYTACIQSYQIHNILESEKPRDIQTVN
jgi:hypothetical protein